MKKYTLYFAWVISIIGLLISLYYGEILKWEPCRLCWYQRIALFPLAILLGIAIYKEDKSFIPYALILSAFGGVVAIYHWLEFHFPALRTAAICGYVHDCSDSALELFGWLSFPALSSIGFVLIFILLYLARRSN